MSAAATAPKFEWICIMPDKPGALDKRLEVRAKHFEGIKPLAEAGTITFGGAMFDHIPKEGEKPPMRGSIMTVKADTKEQVIELLKKDTYTASGVWDWDKAEIYPMAVAVRAPLGS